MVLPLETLRVSLSVSPALREPTDPTLVVMSAIWVPLAPVFSAPVVIRRYEELISNDDDAELTAVCA